MFRILESAGRAGDRKKTGGRGAGSTRALEMAEPAPASTMTWRQGLQSGLPEAAYSRGMPEGVGSAATVVTALVALAALIVSIRASRRVARKREFELLLERIDREAAKREAETRAVTERIDREAAERDERFEREVAKREEAIRDVLGRSDRKFEALQRRSDELYRQSVEIASRVAHTEAVLETAAEAGPATGQSDAVAAQDVPGDRPSE